MTSYPPLPPPLPQDDNVPEYPQVAQQGYVGHGHGGYLPQHGYPGLGYPPQQGFQFLPGQGYGGYPPPQQVFPGQVYPPLQGYPTPQYTPQLQYVQPPPRQNRLSGDHGFVRRWRYCWSWCCRCMTSC